MSEFKCENCGAKVEKSDMFCQNCGKEFEEKDYITEFKCGNCGTIINQNEKECPKCGSVFEEEDNNKNAFLINSDNFCTSCGEKIDLSDPFCSFCGSSNINYIKEINKNIKGLFRFSSIIEILFVVTWAFVFLGGLILLLSKELKTSSLGLPLIIYSFIILFFGIFISRVLSWMALMPYTNTKNKK